MDEAEIARLRLANQHLARPDFTTPAAVADWFGAVQGQDFGAAQWALGLRLASGRLVDVERATAERSIARSWALRGTLHITAAQDLRWVVGLAAVASVPRYASYHRRLELDEDTFRRSHTAMEKALQGGSALTRTELANALEGAGIVTHDLRMTFLLYRAALEGLICFGAPRGKQPTFALLEEWLPPVAPKTHEEALAELAWRFFRSHGPATLKDFAWWSGLAAGEARAGLELVKERLVQDTAEGQKVWLSPEQTDMPPQPPRVLLLPVYDEYVVGYTERSAALDMREVLAQVGERGSLGPFLVIDGRVAGAWKRAFHKGQVEVTLAPFAPLAAPDQQAAESAAQRYADFVGLKLALIHSERNPSS